MTKMGEEGILIVKSYRVMNKSGFGVYLTVFFSFYYYSVVI